MKCLEIIARNSGGLCVAPPALYSPSTFYPALTHPSKPKPGLLGAPERAGLTSRRAYGAAYMLRQADVVSLYAASGRVSRGLQIFLLRWDEIVVI
jgi:hypothetical protein